MNITFDFEDALEGIKIDISDMAETLKTEQKTVMKKAAQIIKKNVVSNLPKSDLDTDNSNYDGTRPYVHMKDDVKTSVVDRNDGIIYATVKGGKYTGYKWHLVNDGHFDRRGKFVPATHFIDKAVKQSESEIDSLVDDMIRKAVQNG